MVIICATIFAIVILFPAFTCSYSCCSSPSPTYLFLHTPPRFHPCSSFLLPLNIWNRSPISDYPFYLLIETSGSNADHDAEKVSSFLEGALGRGDILDGTMTSEPAKIAEIWRLRELIAVAYVKEKYIFKYDISVPVLQFYDIVPTLRERLGDTVSCVCGFGHMGDSNLHLSVYCDEFTERIQKSIEPFVYEYVAELKGSISAEHGIGFIKRDYLERFKQPEALELMKQLKSTMDPNGILNPYKVLKN